LKNNVVKCGDTDRQFGWRQTVPSLSNGLGGPFDQTPYRLVVGLGQAEEVDDGQAAVRVRGRDQDPLGCQPGPARSGLPNRSDDPTVQHADIDG
jgi:hypothetical protein